MHKINFFKYLIMAGMLACSATKLLGQDPRLPGVNFGLSNMHSGKSRPPGWYFTQYLQTYQAGKRMDAAGEEIINGAGMSSILALQQVGFISKKNYLGGHPGVTIFSSLSKSVPENHAAAQIRINPNPIGDVLIGTFIQWYDKEVMGMSFSHRFGIFGGFPVGAFSHRFDVNPSAHCFRIVPNYQFSISPSEFLSISIKNNFYYFFQETGTDVRSGPAYNLNYALEFTVLNGLVVEAAGYYVTQLAQDSYNGDHKYYQRNTGLTSTKESVFAVGPGFGYLTRTGLSVEAKTMWETAAKNRTLGMRTTLVVSYKL